MTTFIATSPRRPNAVQKAQLKKLLAGTRFWLASGTPARNQPAVTLCFNGPRELADDKVVAEFRRLMT